MISAEEMGMAVPDDVELEQYMTGDVDVIELDDEWIIVLWLCVWYAVIQLLFVRLKNYESV